MFARRLAALFNSLHLSTCPVLVLRFLSPIEICLVVVKCPRWYLQWLANIVHVGIAVSADRWHTYRVRCMFFDEML